VWLAHSATFECLTSRSHPSSLSGGIHQQLHSLGATSGMCRWLPVLLMWIALPAAETAELSAPKSSAPPKHGAALSGDLGNIRQSLADLDKLAGHLPAFEVPGEALEGIAHDSSSHMRLMRAEAPYEDSHPISETGRIEEQKLKEEKDWLEAQKAQIAEAKSRIDNEVNRIAIQRMKLEKKRSEANGEYEDISKIAEKVAESVNRRRRNDPVFQTHQVHHPNAQAKVQHDLAKIAEAQKESAGKPSALAAEGQGHAPAPAGDAARQAQIEESLKRFQQELKDAGEHVSDIMPDYAVKFTQPVHAKIKEHKAATGNEEEEKKNLTMDDNSKIKHSQNASGMEAKRVHRKMRKSKANRRKARRKQEELQNATDTGGNNKVFVNETVNASAKIRVNETKARSVMSVGANAEASAANGAKLKADAAEQERMAHQADQSMKEAAEHAAKEAAYKQRLEDEHKETSLTRELRELYKKLGEQEANKVQQPNDMLKNGAGDQLGICIWNVQVARTKGAGSSVMKTMQIRGGPNESFYFDGCTHKGPEAQVCTNTDQAAEGVRVLKNEMHEIVGYGSCCRDGLTDTIMQVTKGVCATGPPNPPLYTEQAPGITNNANAAVTSTVQMIHHHRSTTPLHARGAHLKSTTARPTDSPVEDLTADAVKSDTDSVENALQALDTDKDTPNSAATESQTSGGPSEQADNTDGNQNVPHESHVDWYELKLPGNGTDASDKINGTDASETAAADADAAQPSQGIVLLPQRIEATATLCVAGVIALAAVAGSLLLMAWHLKVGSRLTGGLHTLHASSATVIGILWTLPIFACIGIASMVLPELAPVWQFLEVLMLTTTFRKMPDLFVQAAGGHVQLQLRLQGNMRGGAESSVTDSIAPESVSEVRRAGLLDVFTQWPFCCLRRHVPARPPQLPDLRMLQWSIVFLGALLPCLSFAELIFGLEDEEKRTEFQRRLLADEQLPDSLKHLQAAMGNSIMQASSFWQHPWVSMLLRLLQALSIAAGMSALSGLQVLVTALNPKAANDMQLPLVQAYCQTYLVGFRLAPVLVGTLPLMLEERAFEMTRGLVVCMSSLLCTVAARRAFPADERHYRELKLEPSASKPVLDQVRFCPFCGSDELELEAEKFGTEAAACPRCCAHNVPLRLVVRRSGAGR